MLKKMQKLSYIFSSLNIYGWELLLFSKAFFPSLPTLSFVNYLLWAFIFFPLKLKYSCLQDDSKVFLNNLKSQETVSKRNANNFWVFWLLLLLSGCLWQVRNRQLSKMAKRWTRPNILFKINQKKMHIKAATTLAFFYFEKVKNYFRSLIFFFRDGWVFYYHFKD